MSKSRQADSGVRIRSFGVTFPAGMGPPAMVRGNREWHQLIYATRGAMTVHTDRGAWVVPPHRAVWIPAGWNFRLEMTGEVALRMLYVRRRHAANLRECAVVNVTPLLRELIVRVNLIGALDCAVPAQRRMMGVIFDELNVMTTVPLQLPMPRDPRALRFAESRAFQKAGASRRTLERIFRAETGMSLGQWLRRQKLLDALRRLAAGEAVNAVALELGYSSASAFVAMFRRELGHTPTRYW
ncbi:MAG TPA: helix-turn-helix transcriptional regulator [Candidatus Solibacter sp.]|nr:helix-turn-helix transcriptional regulator [Candidatus Solibacter sp.]